MLKIWNTWKKIAEMIGGFQFQIIFSFFYFFILTPLGIVINLFHDFLQIKKKSSWTKIEDSFSTLEKFKKQ